MKQPVEDIQNRAKNALSPIQILNDIVNEIIVKYNTDYNESIDLFKFLIKSNITNQVQKSIDKLILLAKAADMKINDETFDIESYIKENKLNG